MPNWVGDFAMALAVLLKRRAAGRDAPDLIVPTGLADLAGVLCDMRVIPYGRHGMRERLRTVSALRRERYDTIYLLPHSFSSALLAWLAGARRRRGIIRDGRRLLLSDPLPRALRTSRAHLVREYAAVLESEPPDVEEWPGRPVEPDPAWQGAVALCPGAQFGPAKQWQGFGELARLLASRRMVIVGGPGDAQAGEAVAAAAGGSAVNLAGRTSLTQVVSVLAAASCVVSNDSGLMHLAGFLGTPTVGIFGSTRPSWTRPLGRRVEVLYAGVECSPCFDRACRYGHYRCLTSITPQQVADAVQRVSAMPSSGERTQARPGLPR